MYKKKCGTGAYQQTRNRGTWRRKTRRGRNDEPTYGTTAIRVTIPTKEWRLNGMATGDRREPGNEEEKTRRRRTGYEKNF